MNQPEPKLEPQAVWNEVGHLAEPAQHALADGELACLPEAALLHAEQCAECSSQVGAIAMFALEVDAALLTPPLTAAGGVLQPRMRLAAAKPRRALPVVPVLAALLVAGFASLPELSALSAQLAHVQSRSLFSVCAQVLAHVISRGGALISLAAWASALLLLGASIAFARWSGASVRVSNHSPRGGRS
jgi:hypothetical protein